jgi:sugar lactone lactonase YvrE
MMMPKYPTYPSSILTTDLDFGEGARWRDGRLWCSDMLRNRVQTITEGGRIEVVGELHRPSGLGFLPDGRLTAVSMEAATLNVLEGERFVPTVDLSFGGTHTLNDMLVLPSGATYVGCYRKSQRFEAADTVVHLGPGGSPTRVLEQLRTPNGIVADPTGGALYLAETFGEKIWKFSIQDDGSLADAEVFADLKGRFPDGITLDAEGGIWTGSFSTGEFVRVNSAGAITHIIETPGRWAVAPLLGGSDGRTLFMFSAETELESRFRRGLADGMLEVARVDVPAAAF